MGGGTVEQFSILTILQARTTMKVSKVLVCVTFFSVIHTDINCPGEVHPAACFKIRKQPCIALHIGGMITISLTCSISCHLRSKTFCSMIICRGNGQVESNSTLTGYHPALLLLPWDTMKEIEPSISGFPS